MCQYNLSVASSSTYPLLKDMPYSTATFLSSNSSYKLQWLPANRKKPMRNPADVGLSIAQHAFEIVSPYPL